MEAPSRHTNKFFSKDTSEITLCIDLKKEFPLIPQKLQSPYLCLFAMTTTLVWKVYILGIKESNKIGFKYYVQFFPWQLRPDHVHFANNWIRVTQVFLEKTILASCLAARALMNKAASYARTYRYVNWPPRLICFNSASCAETGLLSIEALLPDRLWGDWPGGERAAPRLDNAVSATGMLSNI